MATNHPEGLEALLLNRKGDRTWDEVARDCGNVITGKRLQQMGGSKPIKNFPDPPTVKGLARGLNSTVTEILVACARSLGLRAEDPVAGALVLHGAASLPESSKDLLRSMSSELQFLNDELQREREAEDTPRNSGNVVELRRPNYEKQAAYKGPEGISPDADME
ncbi:hypothetical protein ACFQ9D_12165 [Arthrobacter koreensis]|uniref:hypothetical protein n=1 Tax=Arthrobacter koreensis TaxID=199136 RepID=UPI00363E86A9